jgi:very-short-patch-repair endonuclease
VDSTSNARRLRRDQTDDEKQLWRALRAGRFAGFKFRRQHPVGTYFLDFYCPLARLSIELDGFQHGLPNQTVQDQARTRFLADQNIEELRFWNHQWRNNPEGVLLEIWRAVHRRTGCGQVERKIENRRFIPPRPDQLKANGL